MERDREEKLVEKNLIIGCKNLCAMTDFNGVRLGCGGQTAVTAGQIGRRAQVC